MKRLPTTLKTSALVSLLGCAMSAPILAQDATSTPSGAYVCANPGSLACEQKQQLERIWIDMNQSSSALVDDLMQDPMSAVDAGCLDNVRGINTNLFVIDPNSIWDALYSRIKDALINQVCSAIEDKINEETARLTTRLEAPYGLGSVGISQTGTWRSPDDLLRMRTRVSNEEAANDVTSEVIGRQPGYDPYRPTSRNIEILRTDQGATSTRGSANETEERIDNTLNIFKKKKKDDENNNR